jgi:hypothetical protein
MPLGCASRSDFKHEQLWHEPNSSLRVIPPRTGSFKSGRLCPARIPPAAASSKMGIVIRGFNTAEIFMVKVVDECDVASQWIMSQNHLLNYLLGKDTSSSHANRVNIETCRYSNSSEMRGFRTLEWILRNESCWPTSEQSHRMQCYPGSAHSFAHEIVASRGVCK